MNNEFEIVSVKGREILDSRGNPTIEAEVTLENGAVGRAAVPSGASTGKFEAVELRDRDTRYHGLGVSTAAGNIVNVIGETVLFENALEQRKIDRLMMNILNGGRHADNTVDLQEFMIMPVGASGFSEGLRMCSEIYHTLKKVLNEGGYSTAVGDEGGFAPNLKNAEEVLETIVKAVEKSGYHPGYDIKIAIDAASSELYDEASGLYLFPGETAMNGREIRRTAGEMVDYYKRLIGKFPICSIEDGLQEDDWEGWKRLTDELGKKIQLVGDDLFVTNTKRLSRGIKEGVANSILVKVNQIGTLTESFDAIEMAKKAGYTTVISHRSGETEDSFIADIAVAVNSGQIKTGAPCRSDRVAKYNQLLRIEEQLR